MSKHSTGTTYRDQWSEEDAKTDRTMDADRVSVQPRHSTGDLWIPPYAPKSAREHAGTPFADGTPEGMAL